MMRGIVVAMIVLGMASALRADTPATLPANGAGPDPDGFIQHWTILEPIPLANPRLTQSVVQATVQQDAYQALLSATPADGDTVVVDETTLTWHEVATDDYNVNLYHFAHGLDKPTSNVLFWGVTVIDCPREMTDVRLAIGSNAASAWWVNGQDVIGLYLDRQTVIDDAVSKRLTLHKGPNVIRFALINGGGATDFCARLLGPDEQPLTQFTVRTGATSADGRQ